MRCYLILTMCGLFLIQYFVNSHWLEYLLVLISLASFVGSATNAQPIPKWFGIMMLGIGIILELKKGMGIEGIIQGITMNLPLLTLVILVPLLSIPLRLGGYFDAIHLMLRHFKNDPRKLFAGITSVLFILGPILSLGALRILDELLKDLKLPPVMLAKSYLVGFSTTSFWSPYHASVALVLYYLKVPVGEFMAYGIGLAFLFFLTGNALFAIWSSRHPLIEEFSAEKLSGSQRRQLFRLGLIVAGLMTTTFLLEYWSNWSMLVIVSLFSIAFPLLWGIISRGWSQLIQQLIDFRDQAVPIMNNEIVLFMGAGMLAKSLQGTGFGHGIQSLLNGLAHQSFLLFSIAVIAIIIVITFVGVHPIVVVTTLVTQMNAQELGTTNHVLAMLFMLAWTVAAGLSPTHPLNLLVSRLSGISGIEVGLRANGAHLFIVTIMGLLIITMIH